MAPQTRKKNEEQGDEGDARGDEFADGSDTGNASNSDSQIQLAIEKEKTQQLMLQVRLAELQQSAGTREDGCESLSGGHQYSDPLKHFSKMLQGAIPKFPADAEAPVWFDTVECVFERYEVPDNVRAHLIYPVVASRMGYLCSQMRDDEEFSFEAIRSAVLRELRLCPSEYKKRFLSLQKGKGESWKQFVRRLSSYLSYYIEAREITDMDALKELLVADQLKATIQPDALKYVTLREGDKWFDGFKIAELLAVYDDAESKRVDGKPKDGKRTNGNQPATPGQDAPPNQTTDELTNTGQQKRNQGRGRQKRFSSGCFNCGQIGHRRASCPLLQGNAGGAIAAGRGAQPTSAGGVLLARADVGQPSALRLSALKHVDIACAGRPISAVLDSGAEITVLRKALVPEQLQEPRGSIHLVSAFNHRTSVDLVTLPLALPRKRCFVSDEVNHTTPLLCALTDELAPGVDCLLSVEDWKLLSDSEDSVDTVKGLQPRVHTEADGLDATDTRKGYETSVKTGSEVQEIEEEQQDRSEVTQLEDNDACGDDVWSSQVWQMLSGPENEDSEACDTEGAETEPKVYVTTVAEGEENVSTVGESDTLTREEKVEQLTCAQADDATLSKAFRDAAHGKSGMYIKDGILYHHDRIRGKPTAQLVLPHSRRKEVLLLAHESPWGGHLGVRKTLARIKYSFYWPGMEADVKEHCNSCHGCQTRSCRRKRDRVPITPLTRPERPFQKVNVDIIGPIEPPSSRGHRYALCMVDLHTRWPEVICLRSLSAKATCEALLEVFCRTGIPEELCTDQGTNFTAGLTREFLRRLGCTPRFSTPDHPESNGSVERWNRVFKNMLYHVIQKEERGWDRFVPYLLWAYREVPHDTTGVSPFEMLYGRAPVGPLSILKNTWTGEVDVPDTLREAPGEYLRQLREQLHRAAVIAEATCQDQQDSYAGYYNRQAKEKEFSVGTQVLLHDAEPPTKLHPRWTGPHTVITRDRQHTYVVEDADGKRRTVHANRLRKYMARVNQVGVVFETDNDFGELSYAPSSAAYTDSSHDVPKAIALDHLTDAQRKEMRVILLEFSDLFEEKARIANVGEHRIILKEGEAPKKPHRYRIPETLKGEVSRQVQDLLAQGLVYPVESEHAHPVVCVSKKDGTVRMCVDYRALNAITKDDAFPMELPQELIMRVGQANYITLIDLRRGYWQVPLAKESQALSAFVTHEGQFAWRVMPFGLKNAAATFQRNVNSMLRQHRQYAAAYLDDIAIFSQSWSEHVEHIRAVFGALRSAGLTASAEKCRVARGSIPYLGHIIGSGRHAPDPSKLAAIKKLARPKTKKDVRSALGLFGYYREYIPNFAELALPLTELTAKKVSNVVPWTDAAEKAFQDLKDALSAAVSLATPDPSKPYWLHTDASNRAVGACLSQITQGREVPISFASYKLSSTQQRWATIEKEAFAIVWALKRFDNWLFGAEVFVVSDHNPLSYLTASTPHSAKLVRWALALQRYRLTVQYRKGKAHANADALSRLENEEWEQRPSSGIRQ